MTIRSIDERVADLEADVFHLRLVIGFLLVAVGGLLVKVFA